jgi:hypothetical protein
MNNCRVLHSHTQLNPHTPQPTSFYIWALADSSVIGARGLSDDDIGKNDGLKWKLAESVLLLVRCRHLQILK